MGKIAYYLMAGVSVLILLYACVNGGQIMPGRDDDSVTYGDYGQQITPGGYGDYGQDIRHRKTIDML